MPIRFGKNTVVYQPTVILDSPKKEIVFGDNCSIGQFCFIGPNKLIAEDYVEICPYCSLHGGGDIYIGKGVGVGWGVRIVPATFTTTGQYHSDLVVAENPDACETIRGSVTIEEGVWLAANVILCVTKKRPHLRIGKFSQIGAFSYVDKDIPPYSIVHPVQNLKIIQAPQPEKSQT
jgi:acetyltransferase-like isoleucine patch superfamily enzyme